MGAIVNETQRANIQKYVDLGVKEGADVFQIEVFRKISIPCPFLSPDTVSYIRARKN